MLHSYWSSSFWNSLSSPLQQCHLCVLAPFTNTPGLGSVGILWSALISTYLLEQLDLQPKYAWSIMFLQGTYGKVFRFCWKVLLLANTTVLVKRVKFVSCYHTLFSNFLQSHCICITFKILCFISDCYAGLCFRVIQIASSSFPSQIWCLMGMFCRSIYFFWSFIFPKDAKLFKSLLLNLIACSFSLDSRFLCKAKASD